MHFCADGSPAAACLLAPAWQSRQSSPEVPWTLWLKGIGCTTGSGRFSTLSSSAAAAQRQSTVHRKTEPRISALRKRECHQFSGECRVIFVPASRRNGNELLPGLPARVGNGRGEAACRQAGHPKLFAGIFIERAEFPIVGGADKQQTAGGDHGAADVRSAGLRDASRLQLIKLAQDNAPLKATGVEIDSGQTSPWWFLAGIVMGVPEEFIFRRSQRIRDLRSSWPLHHVKKPADVHGVHKQQVGRGIERRAAPDRKSVV